MSKPQRIEVFPSEGVVKFPWYVGHKEIGYNSGNGCLPACVTTLILYWRDFLEQQRHAVRWSIPSGFSDSFWSDAWRKAREQAACLVSMKGTDLEGLMKEPRNSEIPVLLDLVGAKDDLVFVSEANTKNLMETVRGFCHSAIPCMLVMDPSRFYGLPLPGGASSHCVVAMAVGPRGDWLRIYDPSRRYPKTIWKQESSDHINESLNANHLLLTIYPKGVYRMHQIPVQQSLIQSEGVTW